MGVPDWLTGYFAARADMRLPLFGEPALTDEQLDHLKAEWERKRHGHPKVLGLPRRVRLRLAVTGAVDSTAIWLAERGHLGAAELLWRACGTWRWLRRKRDAWCERAAWRALKIIAGYWQRRGPLVKVEITFTAEGDDGDLADLHGTRLTMTGLDRANFTVSTDIIKVEGRAEVGPTGTLKLRAHGQRAIWDKE